MILLTETESVEQTNTSNEEVEQLTAYFLSQQLSSSDDFDWCLSVMRLGEEKIQLLLRGIESAQSKDVHLGYNKRQQVYRPSIFVMGKKVRLGVFESEDEARDAATYFLSNLKDAILDRGRSIIEELGNRQYSWREHVKKNGRHFGIVFPAFFYVDPLQSVMIMEELKKSLVPESMIGAEVWRINETKRRDHAKYKRGVLPWHVASTARNYRSE